VAAVMTVAVGKADFAAATTLSVMASVVFGLMISRRMIPRIACNGGNMPENKARAPSQVSGMWSFAADDVQFQA
jgi:hypothetical protein